MNITRTATLSHITVKQQTGKALSSLVGWIQFAFMWVQMVSADKVEEGI